MTESIIFPLLNPNEPEALLAALHVAEGQQVAKGDPLCTLETTKSTADLVSEKDGFVSGLNFQQGDIVRAGEILCYIAKNPGWNPPLPTDRNHQQYGSASVPAEIPEGLRITKPALLLAQELGVDLSKLPHDRLITESLLRSLQTEERFQPNFPPGERGFDANAIIVYGGGGHGKSLIELLRSLNTYHLMGIIDDGLERSDTILGVPVLGGVEAIPELHARGVRLAVNAVGGIGNIAMRIEVFQRLSQAGFACPALVHPTAWIEPSAILHAGVQVMPHAYVGSQAQIGYGVIVNTGTIVSHDCTVGDYANLAPGAILAGEVQIGPGALIGMGSTINLRVNVGAGARVGNSSTIKEDVPENGIVRAGSTWP